jgi:hypothetical protein
LMVPQCMLLPGTRVCYFGVHRTAAREERTPARMRTRWSGSRVWEFELTLELENGTTYNRDSVMASCSEFVFEDEDATMAASKIQRYGA